MKMLYGFCSLVSEIHGRLTFEDGSLLTSCHNLCMPQLFASSCCADLPGLSESAFYHQISDMQGELLSRRILGRKEDVAYQELSSVHVGVDTDS